MSPGNRARESAAADPQVAERDDCLPARGAQLLGTSDICARLGISRHTWHRWVTQGQAPAPVPNIPGHPRWALNAIEAFRRGLYRAGGRVYFGAARRVS